jgi:hypothetical protein
LRYQVLKLLIREAKTEVGWKPIFIPMHGFVESHRFNTVEDREVCIEQDPNTSHAEYA